MREAEAVEWKPARRCEEAVKLEAGVRATAREIDLAKIMAMELRPQQAKVAKRGVVIERDAQDHTPDVACVCWPRECESEGVREEDEKVG